MTFNEFYDNEKLSFEITEHYYDGKTLDYIDCDNFWKLFKKAQKDAFN